MGHLMWPTWCSAAPQVSTFLFKAHVLSKNPLLCPCPPGQPMSQAPARRGTGIWSCLLGATPFSRRGSAGRWRDQCPCLSAPVVPSPSQCGSFLPPVWLPVVSMATRSPCRSGILGSPLPALHLYSQPLSPARRWQPARPGIHFKAAFVLLVK